jgi:chromosome segregation ATPase
MSLRPLAIAGIIIPLLVALGTAARAQVARSGGASVNTQMAQQYQQVLGERTKLQADYDQLKKQLDAAKAELDANKRKLATSGVDASKLQAQLNAAQASEDNSKKALEQMRGHMQELIAKFRETIDKTRAVELERDKLQQQITQTTASLNTCADRNVKMFEVNAELLDHLQHHGVFGRVTRAEPFTQIQRTRLDNLVLEDRERIDALHVPKPSVDGDTAATGHSTVGNANTSSSPH